MTTNGAAQMVIETAKQMDKPQTERERVRERKIEREREGKKETEGSERQPRVVWNCVTNRQIVGNFNEAAQVVVVAVCVLGLPQGKGGR